MVARFAPPDVEDLDMKQIIAAMENGGEMIQVDVEDEENGEHVAIFISQWRRQCQAKPHWHVCHPRLSSYWWRQSGCGSA